MIWICTDFLPVYRCGGWAFIALEAHSRVGAAGGERATTPRRLGLLALAAALDAGGGDGGASPGGRVDIITDRPELAALGQGFAASGADLRSEPLEDSDLSTLVVKAAKGRTVRILRQRGDRDKAVLTFAAAWAELASGKAKAAGSFRAAIPKANLTKLAIE